MKVYIGPYESWFGPHQLAQCILFWMNKDDDRVHNFGEWIGDIPGFMPLCLWIERLKKRKIKVRIDRYDTWAMDHTLAHIILPMLKQLKETKHGSPCVDDEDVPVDIRSTNALPKDNEWDTDSNHFKRWDWVLDEMIFAFESELNDNWDEEFWSGEFGETEFVETEEEYINPLTNKSEKMYTMKNTGTRTCDWDGRQKVQDRINNGFKLFGKYYQNLWD